MFRKKWTQLDGLGALVISPTRELAFQTFEVLKKVGKFHDFSAGLVIGGKVGLLLFPAIQYTVQCRYFYIIFSLIRQPIMV